jgi:hypothetical protein
MKAEKPSSHWETGFLNSLTENFLLERFHSIPIVKLTPQPHFAIRRPQADSK